MTFRMADSAVDIATGYGVDGRDVAVRVLVGAMFLSSLRRLGSTQPLIKRVPGVLYSAVKRPGSKADHSPQISADVKTTWIYTYTLP
jgi:hypothetical protein